MIEISFGPWQEAPRSLAKGRVCFAIGDVHAHVDHLEALHAAIRERVMQAYDPGDVTMVWLGDYIDRGRRPRETLDCVRAGLGLDEPCEVRLRGNHEQFLIDMLRAPARRQVGLWLMNGGGETVSGLTGRLASDFVDDPDALSRALREALGQERLAFLDELALSHREGDYVFAHAGIDPDRPLESQTEDDLLWIREPFLYPRMWSHEVVVVHGHTPGEPEIQPHRIGVDSGIYFSGRLTAVEVCGARARFISATGEKPAFWS